MVGDEGFALFPQKKITFAWNNPILPLAKLGKGAGECHRHSRSNPDNYHHNKNPGQAWVFIMVGDEGFEPPTPSV